MSYPVRQSLIGREKKKKKKGALICRAGLVLEWDWRDAWCDPEAKGGLVVYL